MESEIVLDASAILALLKGERGADLVLAALDRAAVSCVSVAEVQGKLVGAGLDRQAAWERIAILGCRTVPFNDDLARETGSLVAATHPYGLSLGDRACLALAIERHATVYTTDREWTRLGLGLKIEVIC